jgi:hypothetical protein
MASRVTRPGRRPDHGLSRRTGHYGRVSDVDDDQLAALRRLRVAFGPIEVVEVIRHYHVVSDDPEDERGEGIEELGEGSEDRGSAADDP